MECKCIGFSQKTEKEFTDALISKNFSGIVIYDDIFLNMEMIKFWKSIPFEKENWTDIGHWSGTGVVFFGS